MISFRYHIVSLVAVLLALAAGVALGGGPLSEIGRGDSTAATRRAEERSEHLQRQLDAAELGSAFEDEFTARVAPGLLRGQLGGHPVTIVTLPGTDEDVVGAFGELVGQAGSTVTGTYEIQPTLISEDGTALVDTLGAQVAESVEDAEVPESATTYDRMGHLIARGIASRMPSGGEVDGTATDILSSLRGGELLTSSGRAQRRGSLVLVVLSDEVPVTPGLDDILGGLFGGMATMSKGVVVAGSTVSATGGVLGQLRDDVAFTTNVSSADSIQTRAGRVSVVLALGALADDQDPGHYGADGIDGAMPRG